MTFYLFHRTGFILVVDLSLEETQISGKMSNGQVSWQQCLATGPPCKLREISEKIFSSKYMSLECYMSMLPGANTCDVMQESIFFLA